jgi:hypothetical protein
MCDFKPGDEAVCIDDTDWSPDTFQPKLNAVYTVERVEIDSGATWVFLAEAEPDDMFFAGSFRKVQRRKTDLSIESFLIIRPGFEEPRRVTTPIRKRERA